MPKAFYFTDSRFKFIALILVIMWIVFMSFFYLKADEITKDPCSICAKRMGENIMCTTQDFNSITRMYYPNFSIKTESDSQKYQSPLLNFTIKP